MQHPHNPTPRGRRAQIAAQTLDVIAAKGYGLPGGQHVSIAAELDNCLQGTILYRPEDLNAAESLRDAKIQKRAQSKPTHITIYNETTFGTCRRWVLQEQRSQVACLNFASAKNPGGGFLGGSQAQEEALSRASALYASLLTQPAYYEFNRKLRTCLYSHHMIWSPSVPVFRDDQDELLAQPYSVGIITAPAVNAGAVHQNERSNIHKIVPEMQARAAKLLALALDQGVENLVLGAWGCGVFANDPAVVAQIFGHLLGPAGPYGHTFMEVAFSIPNQGSSAENYQAFAAEFGRKL